jgi:hypothetical protein
MLEPSIMTPAPDDRQTAAQPPLADLMARYLGRQTAAHLAGLAAVEAGEVEPYEAVPVQAVDPRQAWDEATAALKYVGDAGAKPGKAIAEWPQLVAAQDSLTALPMAAGNYPQLVRELAPLFHAAKMSDLVHEPTAAPEIAGLVESAEASARSGDISRVLVAVGVLRLAQQLQNAERLLKSVNPPAAWRDAWTNEEAALLWQSGRRDEAARRWQALPDTVPILFNRGMAALFLDRPADARAALRAAVEKIPESSGWHHLGRLYLALAES